KAATIWIVEQLGLAMIPLWFLISCAFTSGTTKGTSGSIRNALVLSITTAPLLTASGASFLDTDPPAEKNAISIPSKLSGLASCTVYVVPWNSISVPAERLDDNKSN